MQRNKVKFGQTDLEISRVVFGGNVLGWTVNSWDAFNILDAFVDAGANTIDTADSYSRWVPGNVGGESEVIIGQWLQRRGRRDDVVIATKVGADMGSGKTNLSPAHIRKSIDESLQRLKTDYVDLYQAHNDDAEAGQLETMAAFDALVKEGKVRYIGASNLSAERIKSANKIARDNNLTPYISLQPLYNLYEREKFETEYLPLVNEEGLAVIPFYALASGFLTGKYRSEDDFSKSPRGRGMAKYFNERGMKILEGMDEVAVETKRSLAEIAIAWQLAKEFITAPIASATTVEQLNTLIGGMTLSLSPAQVALLDSVSRYK